MNVLDAATGCCAGNADIILGSEVVTVICFEELNVFTGCVKTF